MNKFLKMSLLSLSLVAGFGVNAMEEEPDVNAMEQEFGYVSDSDLALCKLEFNTKRSYEEKRDFFSSILGDEEYGVFLNPKKDKLFNVALASSIARKDVAGLSAALSFGSFGLIAYHQFGQECKVVDSECVGLNPIQYAFRVDNALAQKFLEFAWQQCKQVKSEYVFFNFISYYKLGLNHLGTLIRGIAQSLNEEDCKQWEKIPGIKKYMSEQGLSVRSTANPNYLLPIPRFDSSRRPSRSSNTPAKVQNNLRQTRGQGNKSKKKRSPQLNTRQIPGAPYLIIKKR